MRSTTRHAPGAVPMMMSAPDQREPAGGSFRAWQLGLRVVQVRWVAFLTALLYLVYAFMEWQLGESAPLARLQVLRAAAVAALLITIGLMSFRAALHGPMRLLLLLAPVMAIGGNLYLSAGAQNFTAYAPEIYLAIIWTFTVSGLTLRPATLSALLSTGLVLAYTEHFHASQAIPYLHLLWVISALAFGLLGAYLLELSYREMFAQQHQLQRQAAVDDLTGLWNRRRIRDELAREAARSERTGKPLSLLMLDIDHFKRVNDEHGHAAGDELLVEFAELLRERVRAIDAVSRFGGEEFLVVMPETGPEGAQAAAEKLRRTIAEHAFSVGGARTATFGVSTYRPGESLDQFIQRADAAMYRAKRAGRDRVMASDEQTTRTSAPH